MATNNQKSPEVIKKKTQKRTFTGKVEGLTDLFKLKVAKVVKQDSGATEGAHPETHANEFTAWEHCHAFRTYDKQGKLCEYSVPIGGHFHIVKTKAGVNADEPVIITEVSPPMVMGNRKVNGRMVQVPVPANDYDFHTHEVEYVRSSKFETSAANFEAAAVVAFEANKTAPVSGVIVD
jgi:hypothetical protein